MIAEAVTDNASVGVDSDVTRNATDPGCSRCDELDKIGPVHRRDNGLWEPHCRTCHSHRHYACAECQKCMPNGHRLDRRYCSSTCRVAVLEYRRSPEGLAEAAAAKAYWESPEMQAQVAAIRAVAAMGDAWDGKTPREPDPIADAARETATSCGLCGADLSGSAIVWRLSRGYSVLPVCFACRCTYWKGVHSAYHCEDCRPAGRWAAIRWSCPKAYSRQHPKTHCDGCHPKMWREPKPCEGDCGRLVANHLRVRPAYRRGESGNYSRFAWNEGGQPRVFCSKRCQRISAGRDREAKREDREPIVCACGERLDARRRDAAYCSSACRQRAYRQRPRTSVTSVTSVTPEATA